MFLTIATFLSILLFVSAPLVTYWLLARPGWPMWLAKHRTAVAVILVVLIGIVVVQVGIIWFEISMIQERLRLS